MSLTVVSPDPDVRKALAASELVVCESIDTVDRTARALAVLPRAPLATGVELMLRSPQLLGVLFVDDPPQLATLATRVTSADALALDRLLGEGTQIHTLAIRDHTGKAQCLAALDALKLPPSLLDRVEQCVDEMLMNALYAAPVDAHGKPLFAGMPVRKRLGLRTDREVTVRYGFDGKRLALSVRDTFGSLKRATVVDYLHKSLHAADAVDRKAGGAGLGLYLMATAATALIFDVVPGVATETTCVFDVRQSALEQLAYVTHDAATQPLAPARIVRLPSKRRRAMFAAIAAAALIAVSLVGYRIVRGPNVARIAVTTTNGATIDIDGRAVGTAPAGTLSVDDLTPGRSYRIVARQDGYETRREVVRPKRGANALSLELAALATLEVDTQPSDAIVEVAGKTIGSTPLAITSLAPGSTASLVFHKPGYRMATAQVQVPPRGQRQRVTHALDRDEGLVKVHFDSNPPGAAIVRTGEPMAVDRTYTPADVYVEADQIQRFTLMMPDHAPLVIAPFTPTRGGADLTKGGDLAPLGSTAP